MSNTPFGAILAIALAGTTLVPGALTAEILTDLRPILYDTETPDRLYITDPIDIRTPVLFSQALARHPDVTTLALASQGGVVHYGLALAYAVRAAGLNTHIPADTVCASACAFAFFAGAERTAEGGLGVHRLSHANQSLEAGQIALADIVSAYSEFDVPTEVLRRMLTTPSEGMYVFRPAEMVALGLTGAAPADDAAGEAAALREQVTKLEAALNAETRARLAEAAAAQALRERLGEADTELSALIKAVEEARQVAEDTLVRLAAAEDANADLNEKLAAARQQNQTQTQTPGAASGDETKLREQLAEALAAKFAAETDADAAIAEAARLAALLATATAALEEERAVSAETHRQMALLEEQTTQLRSQLNQLRALLDDYEARDRTAQAQVQRLGADLNAALARVAVEQRKRAELEAVERARAAEDASRLAEEISLLKGEATEFALFRSAFLERMRQLFDGRDGVKIVGDRLVFSSEVLFDPGGTDLSDGGRRQIAGVVVGIAELVGERPNDVDWMIRIDGHTDNTRLGAGGPFADNRELSQARARAVVDYMTGELGFPPDRLVATGFGEYRPVALGDSPEDRAANRRIELKLTES